METNRIAIDTSGSGRKEVLEEALRYTVYNELDKKQSFHIRLLAEEVMGMVAAITENFEGVFWMETTAGRTCLIHLTVHSDMNLVKRRQLLDVASDKKNSAARGFMDRMGEFIKNMLFNLDDLTRLEEEYGYQPMQYGTIGMGDLDSATTNYMIYSWSMKKYQESLNDKKEDDPETASAWDELEKSIVANIADDVLVGIRGDVVEMVIKKKL